MWLDPSTDVLVDSPERSSPFHVKRHAFAPTSTLGTIYRSRALMATSQPWRWHATANEPIRVTHVGHAW
jgi:hypothetical protein